MKDGVIWWHQLGHLVEPTEQKEHRARTVDFARNIFNMLQIE